MEKYDDLQDFLMTCLCIVLFLIVPLVFLFIYHPDVLLNLFLYSIGFCAWLFSLGIVGFFVESRFFIFRLFGYCLLSVWLLITLCIMHYIVKSGYWPLDHDWQYRPMYFR